MIYSQFITATSKYLKSVRIIKDYVTFDMVFPQTWMIPKKAPENVEILQNQDKDGSIVTSFVCVSNVTLINVVEETIERVIKTNIEREEKERLFKNKVSELKQIFEKENLENLKGLKFDLEEFANLITNTDEQNDTSDRERVETAK
jgi:ATP-dependent Lon protease